MLPTLYLWLSVIGAIFTLNAWLPVRRISPLVVPSFFAGWLTSELPLHHIAWQALATLGFVAAGALESWQGWLGLAISFASWGGLLALLPVLRSAEETVEAALQGALGENYAGTILPAVTQRMNADSISNRVLLPFRFHHPAVRVTRNIPYVRNGDPRNSLDLYAPAHGVSSAPVLLQIHGGGWVIGNKQQQALPLMNHMAARGWICASINYHLSPRATWPEHLIDIKRALRWVREEIHEYGGDPEFVVTTGGSAGGHLSSLLALTANDPEFQPGFEDVDTSLAGAVPFYGVYDWSSEEYKAFQGLVMFLEKVVVKRSREEAPEVFRAASPLHRIHPDAPPFFVLHGSHDGLISVEEGREFARRLAEVSKSPVAYAEVAGAQHAFDLFHSPRCIRVVDGVGRFLATLYSDHLQDQRG